MDRRSFLLGASGIAGALITPNFLNDIVEHISKFSSPLIVAPLEPRKLLHAIDDGAGGFELWLGNNPSEDRPPRWTWAEFFAETRDWCEETVIVHFVETAGLTEQEAMDEARNEAEISFVWDWYGRHRSGNALAFNYLYGLELGPKLGNPLGVGEIQFSEGTSPAHHRLMVRAADLLSLSLLQARLTELGTGIAIRHYGSTADNAVKLLMKGAA